MGPLGMAGIAEAAQRRQELIRRGLYGLNSARRVARSIAKGKSLRESFAAERGNLAAHREARRKRLAIAKSVDAASERFGTLLGWSAVIDNRTTSDCREANGKNFRADQRPARGFPGGVHPHCRCVPRAPFPNARTLQ